MTWFIPFLSILGGLLLLMVGGVPIAFAFLGVTAAGVWILQGGGLAFQQLVLSMIGSVSSFALVPIPLFIFMGAVLWRSDLGQKAVDAIELSLGRLPGRLSLLALTSGGVFSALSGSTMANTAMLGRLLMPQMISRKYAEDMSMGPIMAAGGLAMMIPPSSLAVVLATLAKLSVAQVLIAAIVPGLLMAAGYAAYIITRAVIRPDAAPEARTEKVKWLLALKALSRDVFPLGIIILAVTGLIILGFATPTEAAAMGALASLLLCVFYRRLTVGLIRESLVDTLKISVMAFAILAGALGFTQILAYSGATSGLLSAVFALDITPIMAVIMMMVVVLILGCFMDQVAIMLITLPFFMPIVQAIGFDPVVFGVLMLVNLETALMTPPLGLLLMVMKGAAPPGTSLGQIYRAAIPYIMVNIVVIAFVVAFPQVVSTVVEAVFSPRVR